MIYKFKNCFSASIDFILEPSTDLITLDSEDLLEIVIDGYDLQSPLECNFIERGFVIWIPGKAKIKVSVNGIKIDTLYEDFDW